MLSAVGSVLADLKLAAPDAKIRHYITLSKGDTISVRAFLSPERFFQVKASEFIELRDEYAAYVRAYSLYHELVPAPCGYGQYQGWAIMVTQGIHHESFLLEVALTAPEKWRAVINGLYRYFEICGQVSAAPATLETHAAFLDRLLHHFTDTPYARLASHWVERGRAMGVEAVAHVVQHGDFVQNNLATSRGNLVIFDWEDFSKFYVPGLDLCSLCFSVAPQLDAMRSLMRGGDHHARSLGSFASRACASTGLDWSMFRQLIPLYLLIFLYSKREYDQAGQDRIAAMIRQLTD